MNRPHERGSGHEKLDPHRTDGGVSGEVESPDTSMEGCHLDVEQLGGITSASVSLPPGVSLLTGENATNRSSLLRSVAAVIGGESAAAHLKTDVDKGAVTATIGGETYTRSYKREGSAVRKGGEPFTDQSELVDTFVALFADNPIRRAVSQGEDLRELLMGPVDTARLNTQIEALREEQARLESRREEITDLERDLPGLEEEKREYADELERLEEEIAELEAEIESFDGEDQESDEMEALRGELDELRSSVSSVESDIDENEDKLEFRESERTEMQEELEQIESRLAEFDEPDALQEQEATHASAIEAREGDKRDLEVALEDLQTAIQANEELLDGTLERLGIGDDGDHVTDALDPEAQVLECWTCGSKVERATLDEQVERLREVATARRSDVADIEAEIRDLRAERDAVREKRKEYDQLLERRDQLQDGIQRHESRIEELEAEQEEKQAELESLEDEIEAVQAEIATLEPPEEADEESELVATHRELTSLQRKRGRVESRLDTVRERIEEIEALRTERETAEERIEAITAELEELRGKIDTLESELVETLNTITEDLLDLLDYRNISRVWLERLREHSDGASEFELHIVRESEDGAVYEDSVETLSESEREVVGLAVALAGYLVHDVDSAVPFLLFDSVEMIDGERMATLLEYVVEQTRTEYLVVAMLPKDVTAVEESDALSKYSVVGAESLG